MRWRLSLASRPSCQRNRATPEPAKWAMMLLGFGAIGYSRMRQMSAFHPTLPLAKRLLSA
jgi:PEP-CTERM motif